MERNFGAYRLVKTLFVLLALASAGCHREVALPPLPLRTITLTDKFFDVWPTSPTRAFVVGDRGKVLLTEDGGRHFKRIEIGTNLGIFGIQMTDDQNGYLCGQDGLVMRTRDGGKTWERLNSRTHLFIFGLSFPDRLHGFFVGDRALVLSTVNGGESFTKRQLQRQFPQEIADYALPYEEPVLYSASFLDVDHGWVVGELGRIWATENAGKTWNEQQQTLVPGAEILARDPLFSIDLFGGDQGITTGLTGTVLQLQPNGAWAHDPSVPAVPFTLSQARFFDAQHGWIVGYGTILYTEDGGKTWRFCQG